MDIILLERVEKLGAIGDVVTVKDGYARNYLLPNKKALRANEANRKVFEHRRHHIDALGLQIGLVGRARDIDLDLHRNLGMQRDAHIEHADRLDRAF